MSHDLSDHVNMSTTFSDGECVTHKHINTHHAYKECIERPHGNDSAQVKMIFHPMG